MPVEQPRRKRGIESGVPPHNRRMTLPKPPHPANAIFKDAFGGAKIGKYYVTGLDNQKIYEAKAFAKAVQMFFRNR